MWAETQEMASAQHFAGLHPLEPRGGLESEGLTQLGGRPRIQLNPLTHPRESKEGQQPPGAEPPF